jgi:hypothetical protein
MKDTPHGFSPTKFRRNCESLSERAQTLAARAMSAHADDDKILDLIAERDKLDKRNWEINGAVATLSEPQATPTEELCAEFWKNRGQSETLTKEIEILSGPFHKYETDASAFLENVNSVLLFTTGQRAAEIRKEILGLPLMQAGLRMDPAYSRENFLAISLHLNELANVRNERLKHKRPQKDPDREVLRARVRRCWAECERPSYRDFCDRLQAIKIPLPPTVSWRTYGSWPAAFASKRNAVSKWLSDVLHE